MKDLRKTYTGTEPSRDKRQSDSVSEYPAKSCDEDAFDEEHDAVLADDIGLKSSLTAGIVMIIPDSSVSSLVASVKASLLSAGSATLTSGGVTAAVNTTRIAPSSIALIISAVLVIAAFIVGGVVLTTSIGTSDTESEIQGAVEQSYIAEYDVGNIRIVFTDMAGNDGDIDIVAARLVENDSVAAQISWQLVKVGEAIIVQSGSGAEPESEVFANLTPGTYRLVFTLVDSVGAQAEISRSFSLNQGS